MTATEFTPWAGTLGGLLIGLSAVLLMAAAGRIAGASTIFSGLLTLNIDAQMRWRGIFMLGLLLGAAISGWLFIDGSEISFPSGPAMTIVSGLIVGAGVTLGNGCTSGHGICGMARLSLRSLAATIVFMVVAILTVLVTRHGLGG